MAETKQMPNPTANKMAMSRALGAAFLNHQVEQLEKTVSNGPGSGNWRDRRQGQGHGYTQGPQNGAKRNGGPTQPGIKVAQRKKAGEVPVTALKERAPARDKDFDRGIVKDVGIRRRSGEEAREKDADVVVVDASVLVHALYQVKKWCKEGREEVVVVPLEALNTLDLLKKGTTPLAQRARTASRILESQVGTNPRILVQRDEAFVLWDEIPFKAPAADPKSAAMSSTSPEWLRRTICCARYEVGHAEETLKAANAKPRPSPKVVLAVLSSPPSLSPAAVASKLPESNDLTPVPRPAPAQPQPNKHEARLAGTLLSHWAAKADIPIMGVEPTTPGRGGDDDADRKRVHSHSYGHANRGRRGSATEGPSARAAGGLVERPPAVMAMMEMVAQPSKVVRVLARGEKLDPDP
ncbi:hypothetical protein BDQ12DRAFT_325318 [Crucibulum laeve]|uniref:PIN domain-containing protein n=1 Tax=Crucibulum laeve TaxID=68775 RepID=A0A5C3LPU9_9AGAR|nr:hypothetical protein BDQ12DRAFT_325318 [Crucibulum laeve]